MTLVRALFPPQPPIGHMTVMRASRQDYVGVFVEGPSDVSTWRRWLRWEPIAMGGKPGVLSAIASLIQANIPGCVGIVDADFDRVEGKTSFPTDVVASESHDMECDLVRSPALDALLADVADDATVAPLLGTAKTFRDALGARALPFGLLRWSFWARGILFPSGRLSPFTYVEKHTWALREDALYDEAARALSIARNDLDIDLTARRARVGDIWHVCNGHDVVALLAIVFRVPLGTPKAFPNIESVSMALRLGLDSSERTALTIWRDLGEWEARRAPYVVRR
jgi:hypothetical protein